MIAGVWVGCDDRLVRFRSTGLGQGASMALPIWGKFFGKLAKDKDSAYRNLLDAKFAKLDSSKRTIITDCSKYHGWGAGAGGQSDLTKIIESEVPTDEMESKYDNLDEEELEMKMNSDKPKEAPPAKKPEPSPAAIDEKKTTGKKQEVK